MAAASNLERVALVPPLPEAPCSLTHFIRTGDLVDDEVFQCRKSGYGFVGLWVLREWLTENERGERVGLVFLETWVCLSFFNE